jgi:hypothetical protein
MGKIEYTEAISAIGDSFSARVSILEKLIGGAHYPSIGSYKEQLLIKALRDYLPRRIEVATGFVLFLRDPEQNEMHEHFDKLNQSAFDVSKQCDLIVFDSSEYAPLFRDEGFVVVRPEAVLAIIEVKGSLGSKSLDETLNAFWDFGIKWLASEKYLEKDQRKVEGFYPSLILMSWDVKRRSNKARDISDAGILEKVSRFHAEKFHGDPWRKSPFLDQIYIHSTLQVSHCVSVDSDNEISSGFSSSSGRFLRKNELGSFEYRGYKTISALIAHLQYIIDSDRFNRFFSYADEFRHLPEVEPRSRHYRKVWSS